MPRALRFILRARTEIKFVLRVASTLENATGEQRVLVVQSLLNVCELKFVTFFIITEMRYLWYVSILS